MRFPLLMLAVLLAASTAAADTIVLKNGRRITATNVVEENGKVSYETAAGRFSLSASIVEKIERNAAAALPASDAAKVGGLSVAPPRFEILDGFADVARATIRDGSIDREFIARLEVAAQAGDTTAITQVVAAHHTAAEFEISRGGIERAIAHCRRALSFAPEHLGLLLNISYLHLKRSEYTPALGYLERARRVAPDSADVAKLTGWAYYGMNQVERAVAEWKRAIAIRPDADLVQALEKAQRDQAAESGFREGESRHFQLRYDGAATPALAKEVLRELEAHFRAIESELDFSPPESIGVILYTGREFSDITRAPAWAGAVNDGRIRVPVQGLTSMTPELSRVLKHELAHSFIQQKTRGRCPVWLNEGVAQWFEGLRSGRNAQNLVAAYDQNATPPLAALEGSWMQFPADAAGLAYAWSLAVTETTIHAGGMSDIQRLLDRFTTEPSVEAALRSVLRSDYSDLAKQTAEYLKRTYLR